jgi:cytochrome c-type biogenesis protein
MGFIWSVGAGLAIGAGGTVPVPAPPVAAPGGAGGAGRRCPARPVLPEAGVTPGSPIPGSLFLAAGAAAAFNPCGIAMLPAYVALLLGCDGAGPVRWPAGLAAGVTMTAGFLTVFGLAGSAGALALPLLAAVLPYLGIAIGAALACLGFLLLSGRGLWSAWLTHLGDRITPAAGSGLRGAYVYGIAYSLASLGCAFPLFVALVAGAASAGSWPEAALAFALYALGMGAVVTAVSVAATLAREALQRFLKRALPWVERLSGAVILAMGLYLLHYWLAGPGASLLRG